MCNTFRFGTGREICKRFYYVGDEDDHYEVSEGDKYSLSYIDLVKLYNFINKNSLLINERFDAEKKAIHDIKGL